MAQARAQEPERWARWVALARTEVRARGVFLGSGGRTEMRVARALVLAPVWGEALALTLVRKRTRERVMALAPKQIPERMQEKTKGENEMNAKVH